VLRDFQLHHFATEAVSIEHK